MAAILPRQTWLGPFAAACCAAWTGCRPAAEPARPLVLLASGDTAGWIVPCGCTSNQSGGLPRRATCLEEIRRDADAVVVDVGGAAAGTSAYDRAKFEAILQGELAMGIAAHNIGASEAAFGADYLREVSQRLGVPFVSANVRAADGKPLAEPLRIVEASGRRVSIIGVLSPKFKGPGLQVAPPGQAARDALRQSAGLCYSHVVLAYLPDDELRQLAESLPEVDAVIGGPTGQPVQPKQFGPTLLISATRQGKFLARLDSQAVTKTSGRWSGTIVELDEHLADDPAQVENVGRFRELLAQRDFTPGDTSWSQSLPPQLPEGFAAAGSEACRKCHAAECKSWDASRHAAAWKSLTTKGAQADPDCQRCHTTGYGLPGGFVSAVRSTARVAVGCEDCHGPSQGHVRDPRVRTTHFAESKNGCTRCHDHENSPKFELETYWAKVRHGKAAGKEEGR
jgi:hypothetical protein